MATKNITEKTLYQFIDLAIRNDKRTLAKYIKKEFQSLLSNQSDDSNKLVDLLNHLDSAHKFNSLDNEIIPVDSDTRMDLLKFEYPPIKLPTPVWPDNVISSLNAVIKERQQVEKLYKNDISPSKSALFIGPPGVGKTLAAKWIANQLELPLFILDLSTVMSSFLGKTGSNIRQVIDFAKKKQCILFLDELDAIAKKRDDAIEIGELKRLVTVLIQEIDGWPESSLLLSATNHPDLLDPAIWRRFDNIIEFPKPSDIQIKMLIHARLGDIIHDSILEDILTITLSDASFSDIDRDLNRILRDSIINDSSLSDSIFAYIEQKSFKDTMSIKKEIATKLHSKGYSQRKISNILNISRPTIQKAINKSR